MTQRYLHLRDGMLRGAGFLDDPRLLRVLLLLNGEGEEARVVGGAVRNALLGLVPGDIDVAVTVPPDVVVARAGAAGIRVVPTGIAHGTVTLVCGGLPVEVTTLREDIETDGRHAVVLFGRDFARDAERRDFTVNGLSLGADGRVHDTVGGVDDLAAGRLRFIGDAAARIREDHLRILRFFRFHATYGLGPLDAEGLAASVAGRDGIGRLSRERVRSETLKLLAAPAPAGVLSTMRDAGLLSRVLAGPGDVSRMVRLDNGDPVLRLHALAVRGLEDVDRLRDALRLSNAERDRMTAALCAMASCGTDGRAPDPAIVRGLLFDHGPQATGDAIRLARADAGPSPEWDEAVLLAEGEVPAMPFSGGHFAARGATGPAVRDALARFRVAYREGGFPTDAGVRAELFEACLAPSEAREATFPP